MFYVQQGVGWTSKGMQEQWTVRNLRLRVHDRL